MLYKVSLPDSVEPVKDGACVRLYLENKADFDAFLGAVAGELASITWLNLGHVELEEEWA